ncbi:MAG: hypothetical protein EBR86_14905 [Planctomycetia bacterium]|nr:hypothetical protein [Planctomycetia bacterium]
MQSYKWGGLHFDESARGWAPDPGPPGRFTTDHVDPRLRPRDRLRVALLQRTKRPGHLLCSHPVQAFRFLGLDVRLTGVKPARVLDELLG